MDAPVCRLCGKKHWKTCGAVGVVAARDAVDVPARVRFPTPPQAGFDRVGYQREYMRVYRAVKAGRAEWWPRVVGE